MKAITIHQPWASLIAIGEKRFETRGWATSYRGPLAIHAAKYIDREACEREPIKSALAEHGYTAYNLPTGAVVATGLLRHCYGVGGEDRLNGTAVFFGTPMPNAITKVFGNEYCFGDYTPGRYAWELTDVQQLAEPIPANGRQRLWNWEGHI
jgi:hypothetical protein